MATIDKFHVSCKFTEAAANSLAKTLNEDSEDDWTYKTDSMFNALTGEKVFMVAAYDKEGEFVEYL